MIEKMKKVSIVVLDRERDDALKNLRKLGLVHLEPLEGNGEKLAAFKEAQNNAIVAESILGEIKVPKSKKVPPQLSNDKTRELCASIVSKADRKKSLLEEISADVSELERFIPWGDVSLEDFSYLSEKGIPLKMYEIPASKYAAIDKEIDTVLVNNDKKNVRFLLLSDERPANLCPEAFEIPFPRVSTKDLEKEIKADEKEISEIEKYFAEKVPYIPAIKKFRKLLDTDIEFENASSGMGKENAGTETDLAWLSGYVPVADMEEFENCCKEHQWAYASQDPENPDEVPTKLKNNKIVSMIYPLTDFLGTVPGYAEYDISGWFLLFFTVFFGMIFGDGGYGLLLLVVFVLLSLKSKISGKKVPALFPLAILLSFATVVWGLVTCTWFGLSPDQLRGLGLDWLVNLSITPISNAAPEGYLLPLFWTDGGLTKDQNLEIFCFALALMQLSVAHIKAMIADRKSLKALGDFGSLIQLWGMFYVVLSLVVSSEIFPLGLVIGNIPVGLLAIALVGIGFALSFIFANYSGSIKDSILESVKNIISVLLGVVNVFSDIVSYIRLWAVGLAGSAISNTVNQMAGDIAGHFIMFIAVVALLVFGHGLNMVLNLLSVIVHGVRLNTLEFSSHLGMSWSGFKYAPFKEKE